LENYEVGNGFCLGLNRWDNHRLSGGACGKLSVDARLNMKEPKSEATNQDGESASASTDAQEPARRKCEACGRNVTESEWLDCDKPPTVCRNYFRSLRQAVDNKPETGRVESRALLGQLSAEQAELLRNLKRHFPYRYCFAAFHPTTGDFQTHAVFNMPARKMAALAKKGYALYEVCKDQGL
jgi:hypothetical protein